MALSNNHDSPGCDSSDLTGLHILLVEDSWDVGTGMKCLLQVLGADVAGPVATTAEAARLVAERAFDVALVDINLRGGERAHTLIDQLNEQGIRVIVTSGYEDVALAPGKADAILQKPVSEARLRESLRPAMAQKMAR